VGVHAWDLTYVLVVLDYFNRNVSVHEGVPVRIRGFFFLRLDDEQLFNCHRNAFLKQLGFFLGGLLVEDLHEQVGAVVENSWVAPFTMFAKRPAKSLIPDFTHVQHCLFIRLILFFCLVVKSVLFFFSQVQKRFIEFNVFLRGSNLEHYLPMNPSNYVIVYVIAQNFSFNVVFQKVQVQLQIFLVSFFL